jgi:hypothetical protein
VRKSNLTLLTLKSTCVDTRFFTKPFTKPIRKILYLALNVTEEMEDCTMIKIITGGYECVQIKPEYLQQFFYKVITYWMCPALASNRKHYHAALTVLCQASLIRS